MSTARLPESEAGFQRAVIDLARLTGWRAYHSWSSIHSAAGFPDLVLVQPPRVVFAELKRQAGKLSAAQAQWLEDLEACPGVEAYVFRPGDWERVVDVLRKEEA